MKLLEYGCERVGYFSQIHGVEGNVPPIDRRMNVEELKKINGVGGFEKTQFDCNKYVEDLGGVATAKPLLDFLTARRVFNTPTNEFNVICRCSVLSLMFLGGARNSKAKNFKVTHNGQNIIIEEIQEHEERPTSAPSKINAGCFADTHLTMFRNEGLGEEKKFGATNLYIVLKHRYCYSNGTVINLYVSKEIDAVEFNEENEEKISMDLKVGGFYKFGSAEALENGSQKAMIMDFLAGGICFVHGIFADGKPQIEKVVVMDRLSAVCESTYLNKFKENVREFLYRIATSSNRMQYDRIVSNAPFVTLYSTVRPIPKIQLPNTLAAPRYQKRGNAVYDPAGPHHLVLVGSYKTPIPLDNPLYHTDVVSIDNFCRRLFDSFMCEPDCIFVYGNAAEFQRVKRAMTSRELELAIFIDN